MRLPILALLAACGGGTSLPIEPHCNPLGANACMTPWPSSAFEVDDLASATGRRLAIPEQTLPKNVDDLETDPAGWNVADGFSAAAPMVMAFPGGVSPVGLPPIDNMDLSRAADSPTVILDMTTGARVAHFAEVDMAAEAAPDSQALFLRPAARLIAGHRYAVAITNRVLAKDGSELAVPPGFAALRDGRLTDHGLLEAMRPRFEEVLDALDEAGVPEDALVVAWDFTVASDLHIHADLLAARDRAIAAVGATPIHFTVASDAPVDDGKVIKRKIVGTLEAPLFLSNSGEPRAGTRLVRDAGGLPILQGSHRIPFTAIVPACAYRSTAPVPMVLYGHGWFADASEVADSVRRATAAELCMVLVGTDMRGMARLDLPAMGRALGELAKADEVFDVLVQGLVDHVTLAHAMRTSFADELFLAGERRLVDPRRVHYLGTAQGAILGTTLLAHDPSITRAVLIAGGANYSMVFDRSAAWSKHRTTLGTAYPDPLDVALASNLLQMRWDRVEGAGLTIAPKQILMQVAIGDELVPNIGSYWQARTMGIPLLGPSPTTPWGMTVQDGPLASGSALVILDGGRHAPPITNIPPTTEIHGLVQSAAARRQIREFFTSGRIVNECAGPCFCANSACD